LSIKISLFFDPYGKAKIPLVIPQSCHLSSRIHWYLQVSGFRFRIVVKINQLKAAFLDGKAVIEIAAVGITIDHLLD